MLSKAKRVIIFIVEGPSDEGAIGSVIKEYFQSTEVQFHVVHGDILTSGFVNHESIVNKIKDCIDTVKSKYRYLDQDLLKVIQLADMDGSFIAEDKVIQGKTEGTRYFVDHIETGNVGSLVRRNQLRADLLYKLSTTGKINGVPYRLYYMSCNLEHVLYNEFRSFTKEEKWDYSDRFAEYYEGKLPEFITFISDPVFAVPGKFKDTWEFISEGNHSLNRYTNLQQLFEKNEAQKAVQK